MRPEDVPASTMALLADHEPFEGVGGYIACSCGYGHSRTEDYNAHVLAAVLPDIQAQALREFSVRLDRSFDHIYDDTEDAIGSVDRAEGYRHRDDQVNALLASAMQDAARLTATTGGPTDG